MPGPQYPGDPPQSPPPAVGLVRVLISEESPESGFTSVVVHEHDGPDSAWVEGLINGVAYHFRLATHDSAQHSLLGHSAPLMTTPGSPPSRLHVVATGLGSQFFSTAAWSSDGRQLAFVRPTSHGPNGYEGNVCVFDVTTGGERQLTLYEGTDHFVGGPAWSSDNAWIVYYYSPTRTAGGIDYRVWRTPASSFDAASITAGRVDSSPAWGADGEIVFCRGTWEPPNIPELWIATPGTWAARQLTFDQTSRKRHPSVNLLTGVIVYGDEPVGSLAQHLYTIDRTGGPTPLTENRHWGEREPVWAADGRRVVFTSDRSGHFEIWSLDTASGTYLQLTRGMEDHPARTAAALSPDGRLLAYREELRYTSRGSLIIAQLTDP